MLGRVLAGVRVIDLTQNVAGPYCTQLLGDFGAEVIKVERPGRGDDSRAWHAPGSNEASPHFISLNRNKRSLCVDLGHAEGQALVRRLVEGADVFVHSLKPGSAEARGLGWEALVARRPSLVYCAVSAYGEEGPLRDLPGYDPVIQAFSGMMSLCGNPGDAPSRVPVSVIDVGTGMWAAMGILAACMEARRTGRGSRVQVSLLETAIAWMHTLATAHAITGQPPGRIGTGMGNSAPYELFACADGAVFIAAPSDRLFRAACEVLGLPALPEDSRFASNEARLAHRPALHGALEAATAGRASAELVAQLRARGVPCGEMNGFAQAMAHPQVQAIGMLGAWPSGAGLGPAPLVETPLRMDGARSQARAAPPDLGADTDDLLRGLGLAEDELRRLRRAGIVA